MKAGLWRHRAASVRYFLAVAALLVGFDSTGLSDAAERPYTINVIVSQTGPAAFIGASITRTLDIVAAIVNSRGGIAGRPFQFVVADDHSDPFVALQLFQGFAAQGSPLILGPAFVATCSAVMPKALISGPVTWCLSPGIYPPSRSYVFATGPTTDDTTLVLIRYFRERGWKRLAVITSTDASGQAWDRGVQYALRQLENSGVTLVAREYMNPTDVSVSAQMTRIKAADPQAVLTLSAGTSWGTIMRGLSDAGIDLPIGGGNGNMLTAQLRQYQSFLPRELYFPGFLNISEHAVGPGPIRDAQQPFFTALAAANTKPDLGISLAYDPAMLLVDALRRLGPSVTAAQLRDYLLREHGWTGSNGVYDFRDGSQRGLGPRSLVVDRWDPVNEAFISVSRPGGYSR
jgi:branched-chain amino acid transport system substrate-binding protein